jgi:3-deoxy-alpha-D-manno-octulosonate 8-oxidase
MMGKNLKMVSYVLFGRGVFEELRGILTERREETKSYILLLVDDVFRERPLGTRLPTENGDLLIWVNVDEEPTTRYVDELTDKVKEFSERPPGAVIGIGGGSTMDLAKAVSIMLENPGSSAEYQGWDLVTHPAIYHIGIPTLSGTGAEVSRTAVLCGPERKLGINSNYTVFDQILLDPELLDGVSSDQRFYTGMDCYIHCVESLKGTYLNAFSRSFAQKALSLCQEVFLENGKQEDSKLMMGSYFGGLSIAYSQVGICHALSYGLSYILGIHHGIGNCIVFNQLEEFYPHIIPEFRTMMEKSDISLPQNIVMAVEEKKLERMIDVALTLAPLWENALGPGWEQIMTREKIRRLYLRM